MRWVAIDGVIQKAIAGDVVVEADHLRQRRLIGEIGSATRQVTASRDAQEIVQKESTDARDAVSGVNLDEEAANLIKYQQAYQAAAQMIRIASQLFDSLLAATGR